VSDFLETMEQSTVADAARSDKKPVRTQGANMNTDTEPHVIQQEPEMVEVEGNGTIVMSHVVNTVQWAKRFRYDKATGGLVKVSNGKPVGRTRGTSSHCRIYKHINGRKMTIDVARVVWILHHGAIPLGKLVDHKNRNPMDNRIGNLRLADNRQNASNKSSSKHFKGITVNYVSRFVAQIRYRGRKILGPSRPTIEEAAKDYDALAAIFHGEFACGNNIK
jgi:hypothetical protein